MKHNITINYSILTQENAKIKLSYIDFTVDKVHFMLEIIQNVFELNTNMFIHPYF